MRFPKLVTGGIAAAVLTAALGGAAIALTPSPTPNPVQQRTQERLSSFASKLGKTPTEITNAVVAVQKERVAADLAAGQITQAQADAMNARIDASGGLGLFGPGGKGAGHHRGGPKGPPGERGRDGRGPGPTGAPGLPGAPAPPVSPTRA